MKDNSINICFTAAPSLFSKLIRWTTRSDVSHAFITFRDPVLNRVMVMEATWKGFEMLPWGSEDYEGRALIARYSINVPEEKKLDALNHLTYYLGNGYDYFSLIPLILRRIKARFKNPLGTASRMICSESVAVFLNSCGAANMPDASSWTPEDVYAFIKNNPDTFKREE